MTQTTETLDLRRGNHFVPACYQRGFTNAEGKVWIRFANGTLKHLTPENVGLKNDLYIFEENGVETDKVEVFFGEHVENQFARLSRRIKEEADRFSQMSGDEAGVLLRFVASQAVRTLGHKATMSEQANGAPIDANTFVRVMVPKNEGDSGLLEPESSDDSILYSASQHRGDVHHWRPSGRGPTDKR